MEYISKTLDFHIDVPSAVTFGKFDGLHRGHELLMENLRKKSAEKGLVSVVFTFDIPPKNHVLGTQSQVLTTNEEKHLIFEAAGIDYLIECPFTPEVMCMEPEAFVSWICGKLQAKVMVVGTDFHFAHNRAGDFRVLRSLEEKYGYETVVLEKMQEDHRDISSTFVREEITAGRIEKANHLLGYPYFLCGKVVHGRRLGRTIGIPTINLVIPPAKLLPPFGVYLTRVLVEGRWYRGVSNVGCKPTVGADNPAGVETFILGFSGEIYDRPVLVEFYRWLRPEQKFDSLESLKAQMERDIETAKKYNLPFTK